MSFSHTYTRTFKDDLPMTQDDRLVYEKIRVFCEIYYIVIKMPLKEYP